MHVMVESPNRYLRLEICDFDLTNMPRKALSWHGYQASSCMNFESLRRGPLSITSPYDKGHNTQLLPLPLPHRLGPIQKPSKHRHQRVYSSNLNLHRQRGVLSCVKENPRSRPACWQRHSCHEILHLVGKA